MAINKLTKSFIQSICKKYNNKITVNQYIIERLVYKKIFNVFSDAKLQDSSFTRDITNYNSNSNSNKKLGIESSDFNTTLNKYPPNSLHQAIYYSKNSNNIGVMLNTCKTDFSKFILNFNNCAQPLLSIRFCNIDSIFHHERLSPSYNFRENLILSNTSNFGNLFEHILTSCEFPSKGPAHLDIKETILDDLINPYEITTSNTTEFSISNYKNLKLIRML